jgi:hypothetical protein
MKSSLPTRMSVGAWISPKRAVTSHPSSSSPPASCASMLKDHLGEHAGVEVRIEVVPVQRFDYPQLAAPRRFVGRLGPKHPKLLLGGPLRRALAAISSL